MDAHSILSLSEGFHLCSNHFKSSKFPQATMQAFELFESSQIKFQWHISAQCGGQMPLPKKHVLHVVNSKKKFCMYFGAWIIIYVECFEHLKVSWAYFSCYQRRRISTNDNKTIVDGDWRFNNGCLENEDLRPIRRRPRMRAGMGLTVNRYLAKKLVVNW